MCISGMYDLTPVRLSARSNYVAFDDATVAALSPMRHLDRLHAPVTVAYGTCETPEFQRQNREFAAADWRERLVCYRCGSQQIGMVVTGNRRQSDG